MQSLLTDSANKATISQLSRAFGVSRSGLYSARTRHKQPCVLCAQAVQIQAAFVASGRTYGSRRLSAALKQAGWAVGRYRARSLMRGAPTEFEKNSTLRFSVGRGFASAPLWPMALRVTRGSTMTAKWHWSRSTSSAHRQQTANSPKPNALSASRAIFKKPPPGMPSKHTFCWWIAIRAGAWQSPVTPW